MVTQGDIIKVNFNPQSGHEQAGYRPALVISNNFFNKKTRLVIVCPITNANKSFPLHVPLDAGTKTSGVILCEHVRTLDLSARNHKVVERIPTSLIKEVISIVNCQMKM